MKHCPKCRIYYPNSQAFCNEDGAILSLKDQYGLNGRIINDKYLIEALIGIGGMSAVYCAQQFGVVRRVAFKVLLPHLAANNEKMVSFFEREARTAGRLFHENIATVFDAGRTEDDLAYIVMEWLDGVTLEEELRKNGAFSLDRISTLLKQIAGALDTAHAQKVIHRDLKPSNIMLVKRPDGEELVKVLDFGLAKLATETNDLVSHAVGTPHYASPEQFQLGSEIDSRTDIYSLGVMLYQLISGHLPFSSQSIHEVIRMHMLEMPRPIRELNPSIPAGIEELLQRMMSKTPQYRPQTVREVSTLFDRVWHAEKERLNSTGGAASQSRVDADFLNDISLVDGIMRSSTNIRHTGDLRSEPGNAPKANTHPLPTSAPLSVPGTAFGTAPASASPVPNVSYPSPQPSLNKPSLNKPSLNNQPGQSPIPGYSVSYTNNHNVSPIAISNVAPAQAATADTSIKADAWLSQETGANWISKLPLPMQRITKPVWLGIAAFVLLVAGAFAGYRYLRPAITLGNADTILVADFANSTREDVFDGALKQALTIQLAQTPYLNQLAEEKVRETLKYMGRQPSEKLTREIAREICLRQGVKALIVGSIDRLDQHYALTLEAVNAQTGDTFARVFLEVNGKDRILKALDQATTELRGELGESLQSIKKFNKPSEYATTGSLDALKAYSLGRETNTFKGNPAEALTLYKSAVELDPYFALAYVGQASIYANLGQPALSAQAAERAFALRDRMSEQEKVTISTLYYLAVSGEVEKAIDALKLARQTYPRTISPPINLSVCYGRLGQFTDALREATEANQLDPRNSIPYSNRAELHVRLGQYDEARQVLEQAFLNKLDRTSYHATLYQIGFLKGDSLLMQQQIDWTKGKPDEFRALDWQAQTSALAGKFQASSELAHRSADIAMQRNLKETGAAVLLTHAAQTLLAGNREEAARELRKLLTDSPNLFNRFTVGTPAPFATVALALSGQTDLAQAIVNEVTSSQPNNTLAQNLWLPTVRAAIALQKNEPATAVELLQSTQALETAGMFYPTYLRGKAYLQLKQGREAVVEFERIRTHRGWDVLNSLYPLAQLELARAYQMRGDKTLARQAYDDFLSQWKDADASLPVYVAARKEAALLK